MSSLSFDPTNPSSVSDVLQGLLNDPTLVPPDFMTYISNYLEQNPPFLPLKQLNGYSQIVPSAADTGLASESTTSTTYVDLPTVGPQLTGLGDGKYFVIWGGYIVTTTQGTRAIMALSVNGGAPDDTKQAYSFNSGGAGASFATVVSLTGGLSGNSLKVQYRVNGAVTGTFSSRWLAAIRVSDA